eukprot:GEZU01025310.1.p1 GENE.GEZU01025310.1~~GEZU01025310.1.p1  ORF type:complete len:157 (-),score=59.41 GEZU01025310.1:41-511(-)
MEYKLEDLPGFEESYLVKFKDAGVNNASDLIEKGRDRKLRQELEAKTGIPHDKLLHLIHKADFVRIPDVTPDDAALLDAVGVKSVLQLSHRIPEHLYDALKSYLEANPAPIKGKKKKPELPSLDKCKKWVEEAKRIPKVVAATEETTATTGAARTG